MSAYLNKVQINIEPVWWKVQHIKRFGIHFGREDEQGSSLNLTNIVQVLTRSVKT